MPNRNERLEQRLRDSLEPDQSTVDRIRTHAFVDADRRTLPRVAPYVAIGALLLVGAAGVVRFSASLKPKDMATDAAQPVVGQSPRAGSRSVDDPSGFSDGSVLVIRSPDGSLWAGSLVPSETVPPRGTGMVVLEGGGR
jgi:hypothetical protein